MRVVRVLVLGAAVVAAPGCSHDPVAPPSRAVPAAPATSVSPIDPEKYYAVLLTNGTVYFGKLEGYGTPFPVLRDVYYVQRTLNSTTKALSNSLIRRGQEAHQPDVMILNPQAITLLEPVAKESKIGALIEQARQK